MKRLLATTSILSVCLLLGACGAGTVEAETIAVRLHPLDATPGCFVPRPEFEAADSQMQMRNVTIEMFLINLSMDVQEASLLLAPVHEDPTASEWSVSQQGTRIEGQLLARGSDWGSLTVFAIAERAGWSRHMDVEYDPTRTVVDFGNGSFLEQTEYSLSRNNIALGCDALTGWSVLRTPYFGTECWDSSGIRIDALTSSSSGMSAAEPNGTSLSLSGGVGSGSGSLCTQAASRVFGR